MKPSLPTSEQLVFTGGTGTGATELTAFDAALADAGVQDANVVAVSSVIPAGADLESDVDPAAIDAAIEPGGLYPVVPARATTTTPGETVYAAVSGQWLSAGHGVNVETCGRGVDRDAADAECRRMLAGLAANRDDELTGERHFRYESTTLSDDAEAACAFAGVVYLPDAMGP